MQVTTKKVIVSTLFQHIKYSFLLRSLLFVCSILIAVFFVISNNIASAANTGLTIQPIKISHTLEAGQSITGVIRLTNASDAIINVAVDVEDFIPSAGGEGIQFVGRAEGVTTVRDWITLSGEESFAFQENESRGIEYTISAPEDAEPGSHFGVAFFKASEIGGTGQLQIGTRVGVLIFVTVPGNISQKGEISDFSAPLFVQKGPVVFTIDFLNTGTVHFEPKGTLTISNILGKKVADLAISGQAVLPTGGRALKTRWEPEGLIFGRYTASVVLFDGEQNELTSDSVSFYAFPLTIVVGSILAVIVLFALLKFLKRKFKISINVKE